MNEYTEIPDAMPSEAEYWAYAHLDELLAEAQEQPRSYDDA